MQFNNIQGMEFSIPYFGGNCLNLEGRVVEKWYS
jgi:hypothetical protein